MAVFDIPTWMVVFNGVWLTVQGLVILFLVLKLVRIWLSDYALIVDKGRRFEIIRGSFGKQSKIKIDGKTYYLKDESILRNKRGRVFAAYSYGKSEPLNITYNSVEWLSSDSIQSILQNEAIQAIVRTNTRGKDVILILGALGGILAGIASIFIILVTTGVINMG